jgi:hypothetical protein
MPTLKLKLIFRIIAATIDEDICPYATFHLLGFREEHMDPNQQAALQQQFQTMPHPAHNQGMTGPMPVNGPQHNRGPSQSMVCLYYHSLIDHLLLIIQFSTDSATETSS